jgi:hypothetical protein
MFSFLFLVLCTHVPRYARANGQHHSGLNIEQLYQQPLRESGVPPLYLQALSSTSAAAPGLAAGPASVLAFLGELQECVDGLGVTKMQVILDTRQHPTQSLLHPGLARFQGGAVGQ